MGPASGRMSGFALSGKGQHQRQRQEQRRVHKFFGIVRFHKSSPSQKRYREAAAQAGAMPCADTFVVSVPKHNSQNRRLRAAISLLITPHLQANVKARPAYTFCHLSRLKGGKPFCIKMAERGGRYAKQVGRLDLTFIFQFYGENSNTKCACPMPVSGGILQRKIQYRQFCDGIRDYNCPMQYTGSSSIPAFHFHRAQEATFQKASQCQFPKSPNTQQHLEMRI